MTSNMRWILFYGDYFSMRSLFYENGPRFFTACFSFVITHSRLHTRTSTYL